MEMLSKKWMGAFFVAIVLLLVVETFIYIHYSGKQSEALKITFVLDTDSSLDYENLKDGAENAALDSNCIIDFITGDKVESVNADEIVMVENSGLSSSIGSIKVGDYNLAKDLADYMVINSSCDKILIVSSGEKQHMADIVDGLTVTMENAGRNIEYRPLSTDTKKLYQSMYNLEQSGFFDCVIAIDADSIEAAVEANNRTNRFVEIYGVDNSSESVYYLDIGALGALAYKDEYSMAYVTVRELLKDKNIETYAKGKLYYFIADRQSMYSEDYEKALFPFAK